MLRHQTHDILFPCTKSADCSAVTGRALRSRSMRLADALVLRTTRLTAHILPFNSDQADLVEIKRVA